MVEELRLESCDVRHCCEVLGVSASGFYAWLKRPLSVRRADAERIWQKIKNHWEASRKTYGRRRLTEKLQEDGEVIGKNRVERIMKDHGIQGKGKRKFKPVTTASNHELPVAERIFKTEERLEKVVRPNQYWGSDITYIPTEEGWIYLSVFLDLFTRKVVGHATQDNLQTTIITRALDMALGRQNVQGELITHSDRGSQYASEDYRSKLSGLGIKISMSRKGNCYDNAMVESFFRTLKVELIYGQKFKTRKEAKSKIFEFIEVWYNRQRIHSSLDYMTPTDYEMKHQLAS